MTQPTEVPGWRLLRITGLFLALLLPLHLAVVVLGDGIGGATFVTVADRLSNRWWPGLEWATLVLALLHGFLVVQARVRRGGSAGRARDLVVVATGVAAVLLVVGATWAMLRFS